MPSTRKGSVNVRQSLVVVNSKQKRRSQQNSRFKAANRVSTQKLTTPVHRAVVDRIARLEGDDALIEKDVQTHSHIPDLRVGLPRAGEVTNCAPHTHNFSREGDGAPSLAEGRSTLDTSDSRSNAYASIGISGNDRDGLGLFLEAGTDEDGGVNISIEGEDRVIPAHHSGKGEVSTHCLVLELL